MKIEFASNLTQLVDDLTDNCSVLYEQNSIEPISYHFKEGRKTTAQSVPHARETWLSACEDWRITYEDCRRQIAIVLPLVREC